MGNSTSKADALIGWGTPSNSSAASPVAGWGKACHWGKARDGIFASATADTIDGMAPGRLDLQRWKPDKPPSSLVLSRDCKRACEKVSLRTLAHAFGNRTARVWHHSYCLGVVLVEPLIPGGDCNEDFWLGTTNDFNKPRCYHQHVSIDLGNQVQSSLANEISSANVGTPAFCHLKVTTLSLTGCGDSLIGLASGLYEIAYPSSALDEPGNASGHSSPQVSPSSPVHSLFTFDDPTYEDLTYDDGVPPHHVVPHATVIDAFDDGVSAVSYMASNTGRSTTRHHPQRNGKFDCMTKDLILNGTGWACRNETGIVIQNATDFRGVLQIPKDVDAMWQAWNGFPAKKSTGGKETPGTFFAWAAWILLPLCILLVAGIAWLYRTNSRRSANLRLSRDRAQSDLQLLSHQVTRVHIGTGSLPDSLPDRRPLALRGAPLSAAGVSLPPGPPSSSYGDEEHEAGPRAAAEAERLSPAEGAGGSKRKQAASVDWVEAYRQQHAKGAGRFRSKQAVHTLQEVPLSWVEADRQFYASAAGTAYLAGPAGIAETASQIEPSQAPLLSCEDRPGLAQSVGSECSAVRPTTVSAPSVPAAPSVPEASSQQAAETLADLSDV